MKWCCCVLGLVLVSVVGCATVRRSVDYVALCRADSSCAAQMVSGGAAASSVVDSVTGGTSLLGQAVGALTSLLIGLVAGRKLNKR